jgi:preprotein translocase subunit SecD
MLHIEKWKVILVLVLSLLGVLYALPNVLSQDRQAWLESHMPSWLPSRAVNLGLDLQGGSHLLLEADVKAVFAERMESMVDAARTEMRKQNIGYADLVTKRDGIAFRLRAPEKDREAAYKIARGLEQGATIDIAADGAVSVTLSEGAFNEIKSQVIGQSIEIVRRRIDESGTKEPIIQRQGADRIVVQLPGVDNPEHIKALLGKTAKMSFHLLDSDAGMGKPGAGSRRLPMRDMPGEGIAIKKKIIISGDMLVDSQPSFSENQPVVSFRFNPIGAKKFCEVTRDNVGRPFAIVLDDEIISAPVIRDAICGGSGIISGNFTVKEAQDLSLLLRAGALPAPLNVVEERSVGPTLGSDSVASGKTAALAAFSFVVVLMVASYGLFGLFAAVALAFNMAFIFAIMASLGATLTLPGIAGIILTIGMAVDANVLVYERIREEIRNGRTVMSAIDTGYRQAMATIVDSNLTTLIVAVILFSFGSGPVKGFAVSMTIGIVTSMFSAIMLTRFMVVAWLRKTKPSTLNL